MRRKRERGFTLIEVIMAMLVFMIGIMSITSMVNNLTRKNFFSQRHTQAVIMAQNKIEELLNAGYDHDDLDDGLYENAMNPINATADTTGIYYQFWQIDDLHPIPRSKQITSWVQWEGTEEILQTVKLVAVCIDESN